MKVIKTKLLNEGLKSFVITDVETGEDVTSNYVVKLEINNDKKIGFIFKVENNEVYNVNSSLKVKTYVLNKNERKFECIKTFLPSGVTHYIKKLSESENVETKYIFVSKDFDVTKIGYKTINNVRINRLTPDLQEKLDKLEVKECENVATNVKMNLFF